MAKFPQIPQPDINRRPDSSISEARLPSVEGAEQPFQEGAKAFAGIGSTLERLQLERDAAQDKLQKATDGVTAQNLADGHREKARNLLTQLQAQYFDTPDKVPDEFRRQSREMTDAEVGSAPNPNVALDIAKKYADIDGQQLNGAQTWMLMRQAKIVQSRYTKASQSAVTAAGSTQTLPGLLLAHRQFDKDWGEHAQNALANPEKDLASTHEKMSANFVEANAVDNPRGVEAMLREPDSVLTKTLPAEKIDHYLKQIPSYLQAYNARRKFQGYKEAVDSGAAIHDAASTGDLTPRNINQVTAQFDAKDQTIEADPNLDAKTKGEMHKVVDLERITARCHYDSLIKPGYQDSNYDSTRHQALLNDYFALGKPAAKGPKDLLSIVKLRCDLAQAQLSGQVASGQADTMNKALTQMTGKSLSKEAKNTGLHVPFLGYVFQSPQQAGNSALNEYFKTSQFKRLTTSQQNQARMDFLAQLVDAGDNQRAVDKTSAEKMAYDSLVNVARNGSSAPSAAAATEEK